MTAGIVTRYAGLAISIAVHAPVIAHPIGPVRIDMVLIRVPVAAKLSPRPIRAFKIALTMIAVKLVILN